jgi:hypothetical protein
MVVQNDISVEGFVAEPGHPSGLRFPAIEGAAVKVFSSESGCSVTIKNTMNKGEVELYVVASDGARYHTLFNFDGLATAAANERERWWEEAIRSAWERIKPW